MIYSRTPKNKQKPGHFSSVTGVAARSVVAAVAARAVAPALAWKLMDFQLLVTCQKMPPGLVAKQESLLRRRMQLPVGSMNEI